MRRGPGAARFGGAAFTLIELLVVIAIIAILASLLLPALARFLRGFAEEALLACGLFDQADDADVDVSGAFSLVAVDGESGESSARPAPESYVYATPRRLDGYRNEYQTASRRFAPIGADTLDFRGGRW